MVQITLPKTEYQRLQNIAKRYEMIKQLLEPEIFAKPPTKNLKQIIKEFRETGLYNEAFLKSLKKGLEESSYFSSDHKSKKA